MNRIERVMALVGVVLVVLGLVLAGGGCRVWDELTDSAGDRDDGGISVNNSGSGNTVNISTGTSNETGNDNSDEDEEEDEEKK